MTLDKSVSKHFPSIAISGKMCAGKTTLLNAIVNEASATSTYVRISLADPVKEVAHRYFNMPVNTKDRALLQKIGQYGRTIKPTVWIDLLLNRAYEEQSNGHSVICDDVRFPNEANSMRNAGWIVVRLEVNEKERKRRVQETYGENWKNHWVNRHEESETSLDDYVFHAGDYVFTDLPQAEIQEVARKLISWSSSHT